jgi:CubicO group peptidase (beta-lactamase class C family)
LYRVLASGGRDAELDLASSALVEDFGRCHVRGDDRVMEQPTAFGLGFEHTIPEWPFGRGERSYGHNGSGGSLGFVDPDARVSFGYTMNRLWWGRDRNDPRWAPIFEAVYDAL